jgi:hypothetical protein
MPAQAFDDPLDPGLMGEPLQILAQSLSDVSADQGLIAGEPEERRDLLQFIDDVLRHSKTDRRHRPVADVDSSARPRPEMKESISALNEELTRTAWRPGVHPQAPQQDDT